MKGFELIVYKTAFAEDDYRWKKIECLLEDQAPHS